MTAIVISITKPTKKLSPSFSNVLFMQKKNHLSQSDFDIFCDKHFNLFKVFLQI